MFSTLLVPNLGPVGHMVARLRDVNNICVIVMVFKLAARSANLTPEIV